jgi:FtsP/CotA-like multicopper oxidase with cupredoxin domain
VKLKPRHIFLRIEPLSRYSPLAPIACARHYGRDCMFNEGHELGRVSADEIAATSLDALVYREYLDPNYTVPRTDKLIAADVNEPPWDRRIPGSLLYAEPGERLYIHVLNGDKDECHSLHVHGVKYGIDSDGAWPFGIPGTDGSRSDEILPGGRWTYIYEVTEETVGAWPFHDHAHDVGVNIGRGLFGGLVVRDPKRPCPKHEVPVFVHQLQGVGLQFDFKSTTISPGQAWPPPPQPGLTVPADEGVCRYHCQIHGPMMSATLQIEAGAPAHRAISIQNNQFTPQNATVAPGGTVTWTNNEPQANHDHLVISDGGGAATFCLNGRAFVGNTPTVEVDSGDDLRWYLFNLDVGGVWHNFHPHSARWRLPAPPGGSADVHPLSPVESSIIDTQAPPALRLPCVLEELQCDPGDNACRVRIKGDFLFHCHIEEHMMAGLAGLVRSREYVWLTEPVARDLTIRLPYDDGLNECPVVDLDRCRPKRSPTRPGRHDLITRVTAPSHLPMPGMPGMGGAAGFDLDAARQKGVFELLPCDSQVLAVHATVLRTGKVLFFAGSGNDELYTTGLRSVVWDYENGGFHTPFTPMDFFCCGHAMLPDGRLLAVGGTLNYAFTGLDTAFVFDPLLEEWIRLGNMQGRRWYPTAVELADGSVLAAGGTDWMHTFEVFSEYTGWAPPLPTPAGNWPAYPNMLLMRDGRVFFTGVHFDANAQQPVIFDVAANTMTSVPGLAPPDGRGMGSSVLLPPAQAQRAMAFGGSGTGAGSIANTSIVDLGAAAPHYVNGPNMIHPRTMQNTVILPDRTVFVSGGGEMGEDVGHAQLESEIYDPAANAFRVGATAIVPRLYHSVALLLPDARVITAGSNPNRRDDELRLELFHPPYLFRGPRPFIESAPDQVSHGDRIQIGTPNAPDIRWVQLVKPLAVTHSCDTEQRLVDLPIVRGSRHLCRLDVRVPREPGILPPGWYMLFLTDNHGVPSHAHWVRVML